MRGWFRHRMIISLRGSCICVHYHPLYTTYSSSIYAHMSECRWIKENRTAQQEAITAAAVLQGWPNGSRVNAATRDFKQHLYAHLLNKWRDLSKKHNVRWQMIRIMGKDVGICVRMCVGGYVCLLAWKSSSILITDHQESVHTLILSCSRYKR